MAVTVSIADNADGTGGVATVAGSAVGSTNTLYIANFTGADGVFAWASAGSRTGDGTITVSTVTMRRYYMWYVKSVDGAVESVSAPVMQALTDADYAATRYRIVDAIADKLALLDLAEIGTTKIYILNNEDDPAQSWPGAIVMRDFVPDTRLGGTNIRDNIGYPVTILLQDRASHIGSNAPIAKWDLWREKVDKAFRNQRLSGVPEVYTCEIEPGRRPALEPGATPPLIYESTRVSLVVRALARETRGIEV